MNPFAKHAAAIVIAIAAAPALAAPETYRVDPNHTFVHFSYNHLGLSTQLSRFNALSGTVILDQEAQTGSADITIDTKSVDTGSKLFNEHIQDPDFLDTAKYPTAQFKSTKVIFKDDRPVTVEGDLTIKGVTKPVTLEVNHFVNMLHPMAKKQALGADASVVIKRSEFNAGKYAPFVGDDVTITVSLEAIKG